MQSGHSQATIKRIIHFWLSRPPADRPTTDATTMSYAVFDGTYLKHRDGMYAAMNGVNHRLIYAAYGINEGPRDLAWFCQKLVDHGIRPKSVTIDGNPHVFRAVQTFWPELIVQRCLVHIQRQGLSWCRQNPKRTDARQLRKIFAMVLHVHSLADKERFLHIVAQWEQRYGAWFERRGAIHGWIASDIQRARSMLLKALPYMFQYLQDAHIPLSTNALEGYFSRMKKQYRKHAGLGVNNRQNYFRWYFSLCPI
jgi:transposase-like protein